MTCTKDSRGKNKRWLYCGNRSRGRLQQNPVQTADRPARAIWSRHDIDPMGCRSAPGKSSGLQLGNWCSVPHQLTMGLPQGSPLSAVLFNVYTKGLAELNQNGPSKILTLVDDGLIYKTLRDSQKAVEAVQQLDSISQWYHDKWSLISPDKAQTLRCTLNNRASGKQNASSHIWWSCGRTNKSSEITLDPPWQNADLQKTCGNDSTEVQERSLRPGGYGCKGFWTTLSPPTVSTCGAQYHWLRTRPHNNNNK